MSTITTWWKATAAAPGSMGVETLTAVFEHEGSPDTREAEAARLLIEQWTPGRLVPSTPRGTNNIGRLAAYGIKIVSIEPLNGAHTSVDGRNRPF